MWKGAIVGAVALLLATGTTAWGQTVPGATPSERAVNGAKAYLKKIGVDRLEQTMMLVSLFAKAQPKYLEEWEKLTGIKIKTIEYGYTDIPSKIMADAVAKTGQYDIYNHQMYMVPDAAEAGVIAPLDDYAARGKPSFDDIPKTLRNEQYYRGKLYATFNDGDQTVLALRKDLLELPQARAAFKAKFGREPGCPDTWKQWEELASFYNGKKGQNFYGITLEKDLYGAQEYRARDFAYRWWQGHYASKGKLLFNRNMKPLIDGPEGVEATKEMIGLTQYMPKDIFGWGTPQNYPFFAQGNSFSISTFPSIVGYAEKAPGTVVTGKVLSCVVPGSIVKGKLVRRSVQPAGTQYMVSRYSKHPEAAYWFLQWFSSPEVGDRAVADPAGFWDPYRPAQAKNPAIIAKFGEQFMKVTMENAKIAVPMIPLQGNREYFDALDVSLQEAFFARITAEEAMKRTARAWEKITDDIGRKKQAEAWKTVVESGSYFDAEGY
ncbi:MAG: extracellular solute-binding protein [Candidatus Rokubacteria bacterium]|nr:extracellular solute-binding protein [Candidatus Rokubacteria bacterium]